MGPLITRRIQVAFVGCPNVGKSTLFNALTGMRQHTGNWPGKTVGMTRGRHRRGNTELVITDLPGTYSLRGASRDEQVATRYIAREDWDCVAARRSDRKGEPRLKSFLSDRFYKVLNKLSKIQLVSGARDYRLMTRRMVKSVLQMSEYNRFSKGLFQWVGFRTAWIEFPNQERCAGKSKWPFRKLISYSLEGITGFSVAPLSLAAVIGLLFCIISFLMIGFIAFRTLIFGDPVRGWPSMACIIFLVGGIQLFCMGILGEYLAKTYLETKHRPIYILKESSGESYKDRSREKNDEKTTDR